MFSNLTNLFNQFTQDPIFFLIKIWAILFALICHEVAHGFVAKKCGDPTAEMLGRLSFNPLKHLDPIGTACMLLFGFGWAKPVPVNPRNFRNYVKDDLFVSLAGITANLCLFLISTFLMTLFNQFIFTAEGKQMFDIFYGRDFFLSMKQNGFYLMYSGVTKDAFSDFLAAGWLLPIQRFLAVFSTLNLGLAVFNLLPIPPLDGYHVVNDIVLKGRFRLTQKTYYIFKAALFMICFGTGIVTSIMSTVEQFVQSNVVSFFLLLIH